MREGGRNKSEIKGGFRNILTPLLLIVMIFTPLSASASIEIDEMAFVRRIIDGDTFDTPLGRIRLADVDAPEYGEAGYEEAKLYLKSLILYRTVYLDIDDLYKTDKYGRYICVVYVRYNSTHLLNVNKALLKAGLARVADYPNEFNPYKWTLYVYYPEKASTNEGNEKSYEELLKAYQELNETYTKLLQDYNNLLQNYTSLKIKYEKLSEDYKTLSRSYNSLEKDYKDLESSYGNLENEYEKLQDSYESLKAEYRKLLGDYNSLKSENEKLSKEYNRLKTDFEQLITGYRSLEERYKKTILVSLGATLLLAILAILLLSRTTSFRSIFSSTSKSIIPNSSTRRSGWGGLGIGW